MKAINLKRYEKDGKNYRVTLGNGTTHDFKTLIQVNKFLAETSRFLTLQLFTLNDLLTEVQVFYRRQWMLSKPGDDQTIKQQIDNAEKALFQSVFWGETKGTYLSFVHLQKACNFLKNIISWYSQLIDKKKNDTTARFQLRALFDRVRSVERSIEGYAQDNATQFFDGSARFSDLLLTVAETYGNNQPFKL